MKARGLLEDSEFVSLKEAVSTEIEGLRQGLKDYNHIDPQRIEKAKKAFNLAVGVAEIFKNGSVEEKKMTLSEIGSNLTIKEKKLNVINTNLYSMIINGLVRAKEINPAFEPSFCEDTSGESKVFADVWPTLLREQGSNL